MPKTQATSQIPAKRKLKVKIDPRHHVDVSIRAGRLRVSADIDLRPLLLAAVEVLPVIAALRRPSQPDPVYGRTGEGAPAADPLADLFQRATAAGAAAGCPAGTPGCPGPIR